MELGITDDFVPGSVSAVVALPNLFFASAWRQVVGRAKVGCSMEVGNGNDGFVAGLFLYGHMVEVIA